MSDEALSERVRRRALEEGFTAVGFAAAGPVEPRHGEALDRWLARGQAAEMDYMARTAAQRKDPETLLPGCRTVICVALNYAREETGEDIGAQGRVARYAQGRDYHRVMGKRLRRLSDWLAEETGLASRAFVDSGPVLERSWAERAGLGWIGKNTMLISRTHGSWWLLGEILTAAELQPDAGPHAEFCGTCRACLDACPTQAFDGAGVLDATRCLSYWNIEHRGAIPEPMRAAMGEWIFGCDVCQDVCPWNRSFAQPDRRDLLEHRDDLESLDPATLLGIDEATFRERYSGTPLMRAKWEGMRRNAAVVLAHRGGADDLAALDAASQDPDPVVASTAAWAAEQVRERLTSP